MTPTETALKRIEVLLSNEHRNKLTLWEINFLNSCAKLARNTYKIFIVFRFSSVTDKTTQNKKDTREVSRIFYSAIAPFNGTKRFEFLL